MAQKKVEGHMTVAEVVAQLQLLPQDALVYSDGCDCIGATLGVEYDERDHSVLMSRSATTPKKDVEKS